MHLSQLIGSPVLDAAGRRIGTLRDLSAHPAPREALVTGAMLATSDRRALFVPRAALGEITPERVQLERGAAAREADVPPEDDLCLADEVLDHKVVDLRTRSIRRVSDVELVLGGAGLAAVAVDCGLGGLVRRLWLRPFALGRLATFGRRIPWADIELLREDEPGRYEKLERLHPADIADIIEELGAAQGGDLLEHLDPETAAETLSEVEPEMCEAIVEGLESEAAADILEDMPPDDAADILGDVDEGVKDDILEDMEEEERREVVELLQHEDDTAGGVMTTEFIGIGADATVGQAAARWRSLAAEVKAATYVYVLDKGGVLVGTLTQGDLLSLPATAVRDVMAKVHAHADAETAMEDVAENIAKYDLLALPVTDASGRMEGVVTVEDVLEFLLWKAGRRRRQRRYL